MNIKKCFKKLALIMCLSLLLTGCGEKVGTESKNETTPGKTQTPSAPGKSEEGSEAAVNPYPNAQKVSIDLSFSQDQSVLDRSLLNIGNTERMQNALNKAVVTGELNVGFIGGSITYGYTVGRDQCFAYLYQDWLSKTFDCKVNYTNAGISGTPSVLGNLRVERDLLKDKPDIVFIEFAVNDGGEIEYKNSYESLINKVLSQENAPAVVLIFCMTDAGHTCQPWMSEIGKHYNLPMISVVDSIGGEIKAGNIQFTDYAKDGVHPSVDGHKMVLELLQNYTKTVYEMDYAAEHYTLPAKPKGGNYYKDMLLYTKDNLTISDLGSWTEGSKAMPDFADGWSYGGDVADSYSPLTFKADFRVMILLYHEMPKNSAQYGSVEIFIDGEPAKLVTSPSASGWNNPTYSIIYEKVKSAEHTVEVKVKDPSLKFEIAGFGLLK